MLSGAYFGVISPEGAASILGRYADDADKAAKFPKDCQELATAQCIYANQLVDLGIVDVIVEEKSGETYENCPFLTAGIRNFISSSLNELEGLSSDALVKQRYGKFRAMGRFEVLSAEAKAKALEAASKNSKPASRAAKKSTKPSRLIKYIAEETIHGQKSFYKGKAPAGVPKVPPTHPPVKATVPGDLVTAKNVLDRDGPDAVAKWILAQKEVLVTDTTMRDAHQSLLATRVRTVDIVEGAKIANQVGITSYCFADILAWGKVVKRLA